MYWMFCVEFVCAFANSCAQYLEMPSRDQASAVMVNAIFPPARAHQPFASHAAI